MKIATVMSWQVSRMGKKTPTKHHFSTFNLFCHCALETEEYIMWMLLWYRGGKKQNIPPPDVVGLPTFIRPPHHGQWWETVNWSLSKSEGSLISDIYFNSPCQGSGPVIVTSLADINIAKVKCEMGDKVLKKEESATTDRTSGHKNEANAAVF